MNKPDQLIVGWTLALLSYACLGGMGYLFAIGMAYWWLPVFPAAWLTYCATIVFTS